MAINIDKAGAAFTGKATIVDKGGGEDGLTPDAIAVAG